MKLAITFALNTIFNFAISLLVAKFLGPAEYGRFALASAVAIFINTALFDWIRLAATRFYSEKARRERPEIRATLDATFAALTFALGAAALSGIFSGLEFQLSGVLIALAAATAVANGLFDYHTALVRGRFLDRVYGRMILVKNVLALTCTAGGAWWFGSAKMALIGICLSVAGSLMSARIAMADDAGTAAKPARDLALEQMRYGLPIVAAGLIYQSIPLLNRSLVTGRFGFAETGQFSLAYDVGIRFVAAIASTLDVLLFQIAVAADEAHGRARARSQVAQNIGLVFAVVLPACVGLWLILPSLEALIVPQAYRGAFGHYLALLLPGLFCFALTTYAVNPIFQIEKRTLPLIAAALAGALVNGALVILQPGGADASIYAVAQALALVAGFCVLSIAAFRDRAAQPDLRSLGVATLGSLTMCGALLPLRAMEPGLLTLLLQGAAGGCIYGVFVFAFDLAGLRRRLLAMRGGIAAPT